MLRQLKRTRSSPPSSPTAVNSIHSPVAGLKKGRKPVIVPSLYPDGWLAYLSRFLPDPDLASGLWGGLMPVDALASESSCPVFIAIAGTPRWSSLRWARLRRRGGHLP